MHVTYEITDVTSTYSCSVQYTQWLKISHHNYSSKSHGTTHSKIAQSNLTPSQNNQFVGDE